jgi:hypothetical protein
MIQLGHKHTMNLGDRPIQGCIAPAISPAIVFVEVLYGPAMDRGFCRQDTHQPKLLSHRPPVVTEEKWIEANAKLVQKMGVEPYLATLLSVLRAGSK